MARHRLTPALAAAFAFAALVSEAAAPPRSTVFNDMVINERVDGDVVALEADVHLGPMADVTGDVVVIGGDLRVDDKARVGRHVLTIFGAADVAPDAMVDGRLLAFTSLSNVVLRPDQEAPLNVSIAVRLLTSGGWLLVTTVIAFGWPVRMRYGVWVLPRLGFEVVVLGVAAAVTFFAAVIAVFGLGPTLGMPLAAALTVAFFLLRAVGLTVIGGVIGASVLRRFGGRTLPITTEVFVGVLMLLAVRFVPWFGGLVWSSAAVVALGAGILVLATAVSRDRAATLAG
jgi:hypothetical protein